MCRTLLVTRENVPDLLGIVERVVDLDGLSSRIAEDRIHTLCFKRSDDGLGAGHHGALFCSIGTEIMLFFVFVVDDHPKYAPLSALETNFA